MDHDAARGAFRYPVQLVLRPGDGFRGYAGRVLSGAVRPGDTVTFAGKVTDLAKVTNGVRVAVEVNATNQKGDVTAAGTGACIVPSLWVPTVE